MILLYHSVFPDSDKPKYWWAGQGIKLTVFKHHIQWLARNYHIVSLDNYLANDQKNEFLEKKPVAITFDDGLHLTFLSVSSFLAEKDIPATFFVTTSHLEHGELLWFSYLNALCSNNLYNAVELNRHILPLQTLAQCRQTCHTLTVQAKASEDPIDFCKRLAKTYPIPENIVAKYKGMTYPQLIDVGKSSLLDVGAHTRTHPLLNKLPKVIQMQEILDSKKILTELLGKKICYFAYPGGEYNADTLDIVKDAGFEAAFAVIPKQLGSDLRFEIGRVGVYSQSLIKLSMKTMGVANIARRFGLHIG